MLCVCVCVQLIIIPPLRSRQQLKYRLRHNELGEQRCEVAEWRPFWLEALRYCASCLDSTSCIAMKLIVLWLRPI